MNFIKSVAVLLFLISGAQAAVMTSVETLDGVTGLPIPGSGDADFGTMFSSSSSSGNAGMSTYSGTATAGQSLFIENGFQHHSFQFKLFSQAVNPVGIGGGTEAFEVSSNAFWSDRITGTAGDIVLLPEDLRLVFTLHYAIPIVDPTSGAGGTVAVEFSLNTNYGPNVSDASEIFVRGTNVDGGITEIFRSLTNAPLLYTGVVGTDTYSTYSLPVKRGVPFDFSLRVLSVLGTDGSATGEFDKTVSLVGVTNAAGTEKFNNVLFESGQTFSFSPVPEPSSQLLLGLCLGCIAFISHQRKRPKNCV